MQVKELLFPHRNEMDSSEEQGWHHVQESDVEVAIPDGLSKTGHKKAANIARKATKKILAADKTAMKGIDNVYYRNGLTMDKRELQDTTVGMLTVPLAVVGSTNAASRTSMSDTAVERVEDIETVAVDYIATLGGKAEKGIVSIAQKEGVSYSSNYGGAKTLGALAVVGGAGAVGYRKFGKKNKQNDESSDTSEEPQDMDREATSGKTRGAGGYGTAAKVGAVGAVGAAGVGLSSMFGRKNKNEADSEEGTRAAEAASSAKTRAGGFGTAAAVGAVGAVGAAGAAMGLSKKGQKKAVAAEEKAQKQLCAIDDKAMQQVSAVYKERGIKMAPPVAKNTTVGTLALPLKISTAADAASAAQMDLGGVMKISDIASNAKDEMCEVDDDAHSKLSAIYDKEGVTPTQNARSSESGKTGTGAAAVGAGAAVGAVAVGGAALGSRLFKSKEDNTRELTAGSRLFKSKEEQIQEARVNGKAQMENVDREAGKQIEAVYDENHINMTPRSPQKTKVGVITASLGVAGAAAAARNTNMGSLDLGRIAAIEQGTNKEVKRLDTEAGDEIARVMEKQGKWFDRPGASRAAGAAAAAGLDIKAVKKIEQIEKYTTEKIERIDTKAAATVREEDEKHDIRMHDYMNRNKTVVNMELWDSTEEEEAAEYDNIHEEALDAIALTDEDAEKSIKAVYKKNGYKMKKRETEYLTKRGGEGACATVAAIELAAKKAKQRRENLGGRKSSSRSAAMEEQSMMGKIGTGAHLALYDVGGAVAKVGGFITGADFEGPTEYDARSDWTPEEKASTCACA